MTQQEVRQFALLNALHKVMEARVDAINATRDLTEAVRAAREQGASDSDIDRALEFIDLASKRVGA